MWWLVSHVTFLLLAPVTFSPCHYQSIIRDDNTTIAEVERYHPDYNWIYGNQPRNQGAMAGFDSHTPSNDPSYDFVAILCEIRLSSLCTKLVHGHSGFVSLITEAMRDVGTNFTSFYLDTSVSKASLGELPGGQARGEKMIEMIHEKMNMRNSTTTSSSNHTTTTTKKRARSLRR